MKGTILYAEYDEGTGVSTVTKQTKYGTFTRSVRVHPQDEDIANPNEYVFSKSEISFSLISSLKYFFLKEITSFTFPFISPFIYCTSK